nr:MAG TPA: hypothetical protein [Bacteriophage sp.]
MKSKINCGKRSNRYTSVSCKIRRIVQKTNICCCCMIIISAIIICVRF